VNLISFDGLNCFSNSVITIAASYGVDYIQAFADLWTEAEFRYAPYSKRLVSIRLTDNLEMLGARFEQGAFANDAENATLLDLMSVGEMAVVGMDTFFTPWSPFYRTFNGSHYFIAEKYNAEAFACYDPTYGVERVGLTLEYVAEHTTDLIYVREAEKNTVEYDAKALLKSIKEGLPPAFEDLIRRIKAEPADRDALEECGRRMTCMLENRQLNALYFRERQKEAFQSLALFDEGYFHDWETAKLGVFKAGASSRGESALEEALSKLQDLYEKEMAALDRALLS